MPNACVAPQLPFEKQLLQLATYVAQLSLEDEIPDAELPVPVAERLLGHAPSRQFVRNTDAVSSGTDATFTSLHVRRVFAAAFVLAATRFKTAERALAVTTPAATMESEDNSDRLAVVTKVNSLPLA